MRSFWKVTLPFAVVLFVAPATSFAQTSTSAPPAPAAKVVNNASDSGYQVWFPVDQLGGGGISAAGDIVKGVPHAMRMNLMRPRLQFVPEMLKSVEAL